MNSRITDLQQFMGSRQETLRNDPRAVVAAIEEFANKRGHMMIFRDSKLQVAQAALQDMPVKPKVMVEFGTFVGNSAIAWGAILKELNGADAAKEGCHVYTFELDPQLVALSRELISLAGLDDLVTVVQGTAAESLQQLYNEGSIKKGGADMVFFDHWEKYYVSDLKLCEELGILHPGSLIIADNTDIPGAPDYLEYVRGKEGYESKAIPSTEKKGTPNYVEITTVVA
ncbi:S-adenosyl-L-methionine-dependent methyltransferase [Aspergillus unguis]